MLKRSSRLFFQSTVLALLFLAVPSAYLIHHEQDTLERLLNAGPGLQSTVVFSHWLELRPGETPSRERLAAWLKALDYHEVSGTPAQPGEYHATPSTLILFARPFQYPDENLPAQLLGIQFSAAGLDHLEVISGHAALHEWRLEPKRLAEWSAGSKTARVQVRLAELPPYVPDAILAMEDKRFYQHGAFDPVGIARALWIDIRHAQLRQGASTISQQLARSIFLDARRTFHRKVMEATLAFYLELRYAKPKLLEMYMNQVYWGQEGSENLIGIDAASESFFGKPARALSVAESAALAGMLQSPNRYSPRGYPKVSDERRKIVLGLMRSQAFINEDQYRAAIEEKLKVIPLKASNDSAYFLAEIHDQLSERYELPAILNEGWRLFTTLDPLLQQAAVAILKPRVGQAALVALDPADGAVRAWVGGTNYQTSPFDRVSTAKRQPGSAFKPFVVIAALESKKATTATLLEDKPLTLKGDNGTWTPQNYDHKFRGKTSVLDSLVNSYNVPMVRLAMQVGLSSILDVARRAGIVSPLREDLSLALGTSEVSLVELTGAYGTFANQGTRTAPYSIQAIVGADGQVIESWTPVHEKAFAPEVVYLLTQALEAVLDTGTGKAARSMGFTSPAAGKTGTSENFQDAWFVGYTPNLVSGVWVGYDLPKSLGHSAAGIALPLWTAFMKKAVHLDPPPPFAEPPGLTWKTIDPQTGFLVRSGCPTRLKVAFLPGTEPTHECATHSGGIVGFFKHLRSK